MNCFRNFDQCADEFDVRQHIHFGAEVKRARYDSDEAMWQVDFHDQSGQQSIKTNVLVSAVGQLNRPTLPDIEGIDDFAGTAFHSARWREDADLRGKRVAVIGTGCSCVQLLPKTAEAAAQNIGLPAHTTLGITGARLLQAGRIRTAMGTQPHPLLCRVSSCADDIGVR